MEKIKLGIVVHSCNPHTWETEAGGSPRVQGQSGLCNKDHLYLRKKSGVGEMNSAGSKSICCASLRSEFGHQDPCKEPTWWRAFPISGHQWRARRWSRENCWKPVSQLAHNHSPETEMTWLHEGTGRTDFSTAAT